MNSFEGDGFIVDEASMVSEEIYEDLKKFDRPIIFVGDHGQLEPVNSKFNLMKNPQITLEKIHRNSGDIAKFADHLRKGLPAKKFKPTLSEDEPGSVTFATMNEFLKGQLSDPDQVICAFNRTRVSMNQLYRKLLGYPENTPVLNDRIMCLRNNAELGLFNGQQGA